MGIPIELMGTWSQRNVYAPGATVFDGEETYVCLRANRNERPPSRSWKRLSQTKTQVFKGEDGARGERGPAGPLRALDIDGGRPDSVYGGIEPFDAGRI